MKIINLDKSELSFTLSMSMLRVLLTKKAPDVNLLQKYIHDNQANNLAFEIAKKNNIIVRISNFLNESDFWRDVSVSRKARNIKLFKCAAEVSKRLEESGIAFAVIKTFDNYPDCGNDVDFFVMSSRESLINFIKDKLPGVRIMRQKPVELIRAKISIIFSVNIEISFHYGRYGQVGEQVFLGKNIVRNKRLLQVEGFNTYVPSPEDGLLVSVVHRLYRHLTFKIADLANAVIALRNKDFNWDYVLATSQKMGLWHGLMFFLDIVEHLSIEYTGESILPKQLTPEQFGNNQLYFRNKLFRISLSRVPPYLFTKEFIFYLSKWQLESAGRLLLIPPLAFATYASVKILKEDWIGCW